MTTRIWYEDEVLTTVAIIKMRCNHWCGTIIIIMYRYWCEFGFGCEYEHGYGCGYGYGYKVPVVTRITIITRRLRCVIKVPLRVIVSLSHGVVFIISCRIVSYHHITIAPRRIRNVVSGCSWWWSIRIRVLTRNFASAIIAQTSKLQVRIQPPITNHPHHQKTSKKNHFNLKKICSLMWGLYHKKKKI